MIGVGGVGSWAAEALARSGIGALTLIDAKDDVTHNHVRRVQAYAMGLARELGVNDPLTLKAYQYDAVCNGFELASGSIRNQEPETMIAAFEKVVELAPRDAGAQTRLAAARLAAGETLHAGH